MQIINNPQIRVDVKLLTSKMVAPNSIVKIVRIRSFFIAIILSLFPVSVPPPFNILVRIRDRKSDKGNNIPG